MSTSDVQALRRRLDQFGYMHALPLEAVPLVHALFADLLRTSQALMQAKVRIGVLLKEVEGDYLRVDKITIGFGGI